MRPAIATAVLLAASTLATAQDLTVLSFFDPSETDRMCAGGADTVAGTIWVYGCAAGMVDGYTEDGDYLRAFPIPGGRANNVDIDVAPEDLTMNSKPVPAGSILIFNGQSGVCEIYAHDPVTGSQIAELTTDWGIHRVVGGAYHPDSDTFFLVQDRSGGVQANQIAEIDPTDGTVLGTFSTADAGFIMSSGDLEVNPGTGKLMVVSNFESTVAEFTSEGELIAEFPIPAFISPPSGIGLSSSDGVGWIFAGDIAYEVGGFPAYCRADLDCDSALTIFDLLEFQNLFDAGDLRADFDLDGSLTIFDFLAFQNAFDAGCP